jgi:hypothetical protein
MMFEGSLWTVKFLFVVFYSLAFFCISTGISNGERLKASLQMVDVVKKYGEEIVDIRMLSPANGSVASVGNSFELHLHFSWEDATYRVAWHTICGELHGPNQEAAHPVYSQLETSKCELVLRQSSREDGHQVGGALTEFPKEKESEKGNEKGSGSERESTPYKTDVQSAEVTLPSDGTDPNSPLNVTLDPTLCRHDICWLQVVAYGLHNKEVLSISDTTVVFLHSHSHSAESKLRGLVRSTTQHRHDGALGLGLQKDAFRDSKDSQDLELYSRDMESSSGSDSDSDSAVERSDSIVKRLNDIHGLDALDSVEETQDGKEGMEGEDVSKQAMGEATRMREPVESMIDSQANTEHTEKKHTELTERIQRVPIPSSRLLVFDLMGCGCRFDISWHLGMIRTAAALVGIDDVVVEEECTFMHSLRKSAWKGEFFAQATQATSSKMNMETDHVVFFVTTNQPCNKVSEIGVVESYEWRLLFLNYLHYVLRHAPLIFHLQDECSGPQVCFIFLLGCFKITLTSHSWTLFFPLQFSPFQVIFFTTMYSSLTSSLLFFFLFPPIGGSFSVVSVGQTDLSRTSLWRVFLSTTGRQGTQNTWW